MSDALAVLQRTLDEPGLYLTDPADVLPYAVDWSKKFVGSTPLVVRPRSIEQVSVLLAACNENRIALVPQGGNTGLVGGSVPRNGEVVLSLSRLNAIEEYDTASGTVTVQAGVVLDTLHEFLAENDLVFPVDLGARGSCQLGGMAATNAGGIKVIRYGHIREQIRGIETVMADGTVVSGLNKLRKNNTGYDLKQLFIGSEGTLGVITRLVLQTYPRPRGAQTALMGLASADNLPAVLDHVRGRVVGLSSLEMFLRAPLDLLLRHDPTVREPFDATYPAYVLVESETEAGAAARDAFLMSLGDTFQAGLAADVLIAESNEQAAGFWRLREGITEAIGHEGLTHKFDVTVPPGRIPDILGALDDIGASIGSIQVVVYGHLGDGNLHVNMVQGNETPEAEFRANGEPLAERIYRLIAEAEGSISAEHGIGVMKRDYLALCRAPEEIGLMRRFKEALDPGGILNPGVIFEG